MAESLREWEGRDWQEYCMKLLRARYSDHTLQEIPDAHSGDLGLEAFTHDGVVFQCYAVQEPLTTKLRYERQRDKLTEDLNKLKRNKDALVDLFGSVKIQRYVLMVPRTNSRSLVAHAQTKAAEVRGWAPSPCKGTSTRATGRDCSRACR